MVLLVVNVINQERQQQQQRQWLQWPTNAARLYIYYVYVCVFLFTCSVDRAINRQTDRPSAHPIVRLL